MSQPALSMFRDALQVSQERVAAMGDDDLNVLMTELLQGQAYKCGSPANEVRVNTEGSAKDDGCDGWTAKPDIDDAWLGDRDTCWQFKAGTAGTPSRLRGEATKPIPKKTLSAGGRFVVVASGSTNGKKGENDRLRKLVDEASASGLPITNIEVIGSERLAIWCNQHLAIAARWAGRPNGLWILSDWASAEVHQVPWQATDPVKSEVVAQRAALDFEGGNIQHLHIHGQPGVGKTRFALELCREAAWRGSVIYIQQATDVRLPELIDSAAADALARLIVVADEVQPGQLLPLRESVGRSNGRIRLITIGHCPTPDPTRIPGLVVRPLDRQMASEVVKGLYPAMPPEHVDFVVRFADGYVRLARLAADAVARSTTIDVRGLLGRDEIRGFLDGMLGSGERRPLHVVAILRSVGWAGDVQVEGETVAKHLGLDWNDVRAKVEDFDRRLGIAPRGGRYRYISPTPLGIHLAVEAWTTYPDLLRTLPNVLPTEGAKDAYYERLQSIASNPQAREYARSELSFFFRLDDFVDARAVRRWSALSAAAPDEAARNILRALSGASAEERARIKDRARRETVWTLVRLAWRVTSFTDAVMALALLAEAENETWANNATAEFLGRFQVFLGGTAVPYLDRLTVLDDLLSEGRTAISGLVVKALARVGERQAFRMVSDPASDELPEQEWRPRTGRDHLECVHAAIGRLNALAQRAMPELQDALVTAAADLSMMLRDSAVRPLVIGLFDALRGAYPDARETLRKAISDILHREQKYWKELSPEDLEELDALHARFQDGSLAARLRQHVGQSQWERIDEPDLKPLAQELLASHEDLQNEWSWLTSGEAADAWRLGQVLAVADSTKILAMTLSSLPGTGRDLRILCGYVCACRRELGDEWYDQWVNSQLRQEPKPIRLLFEVAWRCGATVLVARHIVKMLSDEKVAPEIVGQLGFGRWGEDLSPEVLSEVLQAMMAAGHPAAAVTILEHRMKMASDERERWRPLALVLVTTPELIRSGHMTSYSWKEMASGLVKHHAGEIASAIIREQGNRSAGTWFAEHSEAAQVLHACVEEDPSAVWRAMLLQLESRSDAYMFSIGFPRGVIERIPANDVIDWIQGKPNERAAMVAKLASKNFSTDETLPSRVLGAYGDSEDVASAFFGEYLSGSWSGSASAHWQHLAETLDSVVTRTKLPKLRRWATDAVRDLRKMAERDRQREEENDLRRE